MKLPAFLRGEKTILRPLNPETDLEPMWQWINDPEVIRLTMGYLPVTKKMELEWLEKAGTDDKNIVFALEAVTQTQPRVLIGTMALHRINWVDRIAWTGTMIGNQEFWGKGFGTDAKKVLIRYAFDTLNLHKLCSNAFDFNERSFKHSLKCGYQEEGRRRQHAWVDGKYVDVIELGLLREEWVRLNEKK